MIRSSLVKSACVAIALSGFCPPQAGAIEMQGFNPTTQLSDGMISKVCMHRGATAVGPRGGVYHRGGTVGGYRGGAYRGGAYRGGVYHGGVYRGGGVRYGGWARPGGYWWPTGGAIAAGAAVGVLAAGAAAAYAGAAASAGTVLVLHRPELPTGLLGRLLVGVQGMAAGAGRPQGFWEAYPQLRGGHRKTYRRPSVPRPGRPAGIGC